MKGEIVMAIDSVSYANSYGIYSAENKKKGFKPPKNPGLISPKVPIFDPKESKVYIDPKTGELTTWKPGIYNPEQNDSKKTVKRAAALVAATAGLIAAIVFRGKIKAGAMGAYKYIKPYLQKLPQGVKDFGKKGINLVKKGIDFVKNTKVASYIKNAATKVKPYISKAVNFVKNIFTKAPKATVLVAKP